MRIFKRRDSDPSDPQLTGLRFDQVRIIILSETPARNISFRDSSVTLHYSRYIKTFLDFLKG